MPRAPWLADSTPRSTTTGVDTSLMFMVIPRLSTNHRGCSTASYGCRLGGHNHLAIPHPEHVRQIVYMLQRKIEISDLTRSTQVIHALAAQAGLYRGGAPAIDDGRSSLVFRFIPCGDELARKPGTANLVFFPKLPPRARPDQCHSGMAINQVSGQGGPVPEASQVGEITLPGRMAQFGSRGDRKSTRLNSSHTVISYAVFCLKKKKKRT